MPRWSLLLFRWSVFALACLYLWTRLRSGESTAAMAGLADGSAGTGTLLLALLLMPVNWGLEAFKWRLLMRPVERLSFLRAFTATLAGTSVSLVTPNRTGEFIGRVLFVRPDGRFAAAALTVLGSIAQVLITLLAGAFALWLLYVLERPLPIGPGWSVGAIISATLVLALASAVLFLVPDLLRRLLDMVPFLRRYDARWRVLQQVSRSTSLAVLGLSAARYAVFVGQGMLLFAAFAPDIDALALALGLPLTYLLATLVPTMLLTDLGVRGSVAVLVFGPLGGEPAHVLLAMSLVWTINVLLPAVLGSLILLVARIRLARTDA
ncbi:MAG: lysylphosphatidylglycerol synthase domain-containing protein [Flavobacteriales bacterium]